MKKSLKRGRPPSGGASRIARQFRFHPNMDRLLIEIWQREKRRSMRTVTRQEIMERALVAYACYYHPKLIKGKLPEIGALDRVPDLINLTSFKEAVPA